jgi:O-antigen/teichoic acid export membrane protein
MTDSQINPLPSISHQAVRGSLWSYLSFFSGKLLNFLTTIILARLLVPEEFGVVALCTVAIQYLDILNTSGIESALIARRDKLEEASNAAFIANIVLGFISFMVAWISAPLFADYFKSPTVTSLFRLLAFSLPISGLRLVPDALLQRTLQFRTKLIPEISRNIFKGIISVILAYLGYGAWSLVWGVLVGEFVSLVLSWIFAKWKPGWRFDRQASGEIVAYSVQIAMVNVAGAILNNVDYLIVGRTLGTLALGLYTMAYRVPELIIRGLNQVVAKVSLPILAQMQSDRESLRSVYFGYVRYISIFTLSIGFGLALTSNYFVETFFGVQWSESSVPMSFVAVALAISSIGYVPGVLYKAINRPDILNRVALIKIPFILGILFLGSRWGINGVAAGQIIFAVVSILIDSIVVSRVIKFSLFEMGQSLAPAITSSLIMVCVLILVKSFLPLHGWVGLLVIASVGAITYLGALNLFNRDVFVQARQTLQQAFSK